MKRTLAQVIKCFLGLETAEDIRGRREVPRDLEEFNHAKKRLKTSSKAFSREIDQFGNMVYSMREIPLPPKEKKVTKVRRPSKKKRVEKKQ